MTDTSLEDAFANATEPEDTGFSQAMAKRVAKRQRRRTLLFVLMALAATLCFASLLKAVGQMASLWLATFPVGLSGILSGGAPLLVFLAAAAIATSFARA